MTRMIRIFLALSLVLTIAVGGTVGCAGKSKGSANVSGKITYNGKPVTGGSITFHRTLEDAVGELGGSIAEQGTYTVTGLPSEEYIVTIDTEFLNKTAPTVYGQGGNKRNKDEYEKKMREKMGKGPPEDKQGTYMKIPSKYSDKKTSTLRTTLIKGDNTYDVDLKDE
ncbi:MAG: hypothetical protein ACYC3I_04695 [Gemmataceae bacterium]